MKNCEKGYPDLKGHCCCNCIHQVELFKHPINKSEAFKGVMSESLDVFACTVALGPHKTKRAIVFESQHGSCELFKAKK